MKITVKAKTNAKTNKIIQLDDCTYEVHVTATAEKGKANSAIINVLSKYFNKPKSFVSINAGHTSKSKIVEITD